ncbi:hypothetical protein B0H11DRAFT_1899065 [Mycena galericulata]|nr:hypothetical protein B0H11DRAFT_1899065 [Mycena galericulata]
MASAAFGCRGGTSEQMCLALPECAAFLNEPTLWGKLQPLLKFSESEIKASVPSLRDRCDKLNLFLNFHKSRLRILVMAYAPGNRTPFCELLAVFRTPRPIFWACARIGFNNPKQIRGASEEKEKSRTILI